MSGNQVESDNYTDELDDYFVTVPSIYPKLLLHRGLSKTVITQNMKVQMMKGGR